MNPQISIVIPVYNKEKCIENTLKSVFNQTFDSYEIIIVNDGSTDNSEVEILKFEDIKIKYFKTKNQGVSQARNLGIDKATGTYIAFLDADDIWFPNHLRNLIQLVDNYPNCGIYATNYEFYFNENKIIKPHFKDIPSGNWQGVVEDFFKSSLDFRLAWTSALLIPKKVLSTIGNFDETITMGAGEDTDLWVRIAIKYKVAFDTNITAQYNMSASNKISKSNTITRNFSKLDKFTLEEKTNPSLKKFIDMYRIVYALKHKLIDEDEKFTYYYDAVDKNKLNLKTKLLLATPTPILKYIFKIGTYFKQSKIYFSVYRKVIGN